jgi:hypothetical protein
MLIKYYEALKGIYNYQKLIFKFLFRDSKKILNIIFHHLSR